MTVKPKNSKIPAQKEPKVIKALKELHSQFVFVLPDKAPQHTKKSIACKRYSCRKSIE